MIDIKYLKVGTEIQIMKNSGAEPEGLKGIITEVTNRNSLKPIANSKGVFEIDTTYSGRILWEDQIKKSELGNLVSDFSEYSIEPTPYYNRLVKLSDFKSITDLIGLEVIPSHFCRYTNTTPGGPNTTGKIVSVTSKIGKTGKLCTEVIVHYPYSGDYYSQAMHMLEEEWALYYTSACFVRDVLKIAPATIKEVEDSLKDLETYTENL